MSEEMLPTPDLSQADDVTYDGIKVLYSKRDDQETYTPVGQLTYFKSGEKIDSAHFYGSPTRITAEQFDDGSKENKLILEKIGMPQINKVLCQLDAAKDLTPEQLVGRFECPGIKQEINRRVSAMRAGSLFEREVQKGVQAAMATQNPPIPR